ncbi:hypothetical protein NPX13_g4321 [Xylaria arbuscula]|uniref:Uncharacterized protein n=1 Tax=Xylaria arbuscula TaxID=114810 RepID=A0A9W8NGL3_9PEZI|nr:hypothetical protein NPX13_g4321 [Xylaria arbuscula]
MDLSPESGHIGTASYLKVKVRLRGGLALMLWGELVGRSHYPSPSSEYNQSATEDQGDPIPSPIPKTTASLSFMAQPTGQKPNYEDSVASVYASGTKQHIYIGRSLDILRYVEPLSRGKTDLSS